MRRGRFQKELLSREVRRIRHGLITRTHFREQASQGQDVLGLTHVAVCWATVRMPSKREGPMTAALPEGFRRGED